MDDEVKNVTKLNKIPFKQRLKDIAKGKSKEETQADVDESKALQIGVGHNAEQTHIILNFSKPVAWIKFDINGAFNFANAIVDKVKEMKQVQILHPEQGEQKDE